MSNFLYIDRKLVDLDGDISIPISYSIGDFKNPENRKRSVSKTITIPGTKNNKTIFASAYNLSLTDTGDLLGFDFNPNVKVIGTYFKDGAEIFNGLVRLLNVKIDKGNFSFEIVLFSDIVNMIKQMSDINVAELDWSEYEHNLNLANVSNSWATSVIVNGTPTSNYTGTNPDGFGYWYPVINFGYDNALPNQAPSLNQHKIVNMVPYVYVKETFEKCFENVGFSVDSNFFNEDMAKALVWGFGGGPKEQITPVDEADRQVNYIFDYDDTFSVAPIMYNYQSGTIYELQWRKTFMAKYFNVSSVLADSYFQYDSNVGKIIILKDGKYNLNLDLNTEFYYNFVSGTASGFSQIEVVIIKNGKKFVVQRTRISDTPTNYSLNSDTKLDLKAGDEIEFGYHTYMTFRDSDQFDMEFNIDLRNVFEIDLTSENGLLLENDIISLNRFIPELKCSEFVKGVINMFNLYVSEPNEDGIVKVEPLTNFYQGEENWTNLLDYSKEINVEPTVNSAPKTFKFKFAEDNDFQKKRYLDTFGEHYGDYTYVSDNEYNTKEVVFQLPFAQTIPVQVNAFDYVLPSIVKQETPNVNTPYKGKPRIFFNNGLKPVRSNWTIITNSGANSYGTYPQAHHSYGNIQNMTFDLNFSKPKQVEYTFSHYRTNNLFSKYNRINIVEQTGADAKILTAYFKLRNSNLDFSNLVNINGVLYRKNIVTDFNVNGYETTKVELYKVIETTEVVSSNPVVSSGGPSAMTTGVVKSPSGVGGGTTILSGGLNSTLKYQNKLIQLGSVFPTSL